MYTKLNNVLYKASVNGFFNGEVQKIRCQSKLKYTPKQMIKQSKSLKFNEEVKVTFDIEEEKGSDPTQIRNDVDNLMKDLQRK